MALNQASDQQAVVNQELADVGSVACRLSATGIDQYFVVSPEPS